MRHPLTVQASISVRSLLTARARRKWRFPKGGGERRPSLALAFVWCELKGFKEAATVADLGDFPGSCVFSPNLPFFGIPRLSLIKMTTSQKHRDFVAEPMGEKPVGSLAGIGDTLSKRLEERGFDKVWGGYKCQGGVGVKVGKQIGSEEKGV